MMLPVPFFSISLYCTFSTTLANMQVYHFGIIVLLVLFDVAASDQTKRMVKSLELKDVSFIEEAENIPDDKEPIIPPDKVGDDTLIEEVCVISGVTQ